MAKRCIMTTAFGDRRKNVARLIKNIRQYVDYPIVVITSKDSYIGLPIMDHGLDVEIKLVEQLWADHSRSGQRNGDYYQFVSALESEYEEILYLDDDMHIVTKDFVQGFDLADKFGICLPLNPRSFVGVDAAIGADVPDISRKVDIPLAAAYNCGTMFINRHSTRACEILYRCKEIMLEAPMRGPLAVWKAVSRLNIFPYLLPPQWCVCQEDIGIHHPVILHAGHYKVREFYKLNSPI